MGLSLPLLARAIAGSAEAVATDIGLLYGGLPPGSGGVGSERHAAASMVIPSMPAHSSRAGTAQPGDLLVAEALQQQ